MAVSKDLGFKVVSRSGASVKKITGVPDTREIVEAYGSFAGRREVKDEIMLFSERPSVAAVSCDQVLGGRWTAGLFQTRRLRALKVLDRLRSEDFDVRRLDEIVELDPGGRERVFAGDGERCISVLHVSEDGGIDLRAVEGYRPTTACVRCLAGDVLLSKINPRIVRVAVVPAAPWGLACSSEFAVLRPRSDEVSAWMLSLLLRSEPVQSQLQSLATGTSSSHNRIKSNDLDILRVPVPGVGSPGRASLVSLAERYRDALMTKYEASGVVGKAFADVDVLLAAALKG